MDSKRILAFLREVQQNNNRAWFASHRDEYLACKEDFEKDVATIIARISEFDPSISHITPKDATYRFYRDTRFSPDKSPYKNHFGAYIAAHGKKALHGGYYVHLEPNHCLLACGTYWLPTNILTSCRNEIMGNIEEWRKRVENKDFVKTFGKPAGGSWDDSHGFGMEHLKSCPAGFPRDYEHIHYLRMKDYCCWKGVDETFFTKAKWMDEMVKIFKTAKPKMDFINAVVDDYE